MTSKTIEREVQGNKVSIVKFKGQKSGKVRYWVRINDFDNYIARKVLITIKDVNDFVKTHTSWKQQKRRKKMENMKQTKKENSITVNEKQNYSFIRVGYRKQKDGLYMGMIRVYKNRCFILFTVKTDILRLNKKEAKKDAYILRSEMEELNKLS